MNKIIILCSQRNYYYIDVTKEEKIDYGYLWYFVSLKRYVKLVGWYIDLSKEDYDKTKENKYYFDSLDSFYKKMK